VLNESHGYRPDFFAAIGLGGGKQDKGMHNNISGLDRGIIIGAGAAIRWFYRRCEDTTKDSSEDRAAVDCSHCPLYCGKPVEESAVRLAIRRYFSGLGLCF
jgi:hypothetical protein